ncbi:MAG: Calx-beta domain-containing protein, partial [Gammaproteobacteria bacterium]
MNRIISMFNNIFSHYGKWSCILIPGVFFALVAKAEIQFQEIPGDFRPTESYGASWGDYNGDGWPDLFLSNHRVRSSIYRNNADGSFDDVVLSVDKSMTWTCEFGTCSQGDLSDTHGGGWGDIDNDGDQDFIVLTGAPFDGQFFINEGGVYVDQTAAFGLSEDREGRTPLWWDYDNDGLLDLVIQSRTRTWLSRNTGGGSFIDTTSSTGLEITSTITNVGQLLDINNDNTFDYLGIPDGTFPAKIYDPTTLPFTDITSSVSLQSHVLDSSLADFDGDLKADIFLPRGRLRPIQAAAVSPNRVEAWISTGTGVEKGFSFDTDGILNLTLYTKLGLVRTFIGATGYNPVNDGDDDNNIKRLILDPADTNNHGIKPHDPMEPADFGIYIGYDPALSKWTYRVSPGDINRRAYFVAESDLTVSNVSLSGGTLGDLPIAPVMLLGSDGYSQPATGTGINFPMSCVSAASGDYDNDMDIDIYVVCRGGIENIPNKLFANQGDGTFVEVATAGGAQGPVGMGIDSGAGQGDSVVMSDYNVDGLLDIFITNGLQLQPIRLQAPNQLFKNTTSNSNHWIELDLIGTTSNRDGIGARITATAGGVQQYRQVDGGYHRWSQHDKRVHFGLGGNTQLDLTVEWPSGAVDTYTNVTADSLYKVTEGASSLQLFVPGAVAQFPAPVPGDECGSAPFQSQLDNALFLWKNCTTGEWHVRAMAGGSSSPISYSGSIEGEQPITIVETFSFEGGDSVINNGPNQIDYSLRMATPGQDGFTFSIDPATNTCFDLNAPQDKKVFLGPGAIPVQLPFDLRDITTCSAGLSINDVSVDENAGVASFTVSISDVSPSDITFDYATSDITAVAGNDYTSQNVTGFVLPAGQSSVVVDIPVLQDSDVEPAETFKVTLTNVTNAMLSDSEGIATIEDDDFAGDTVDLKLTIYTPSQDKLWVKATSDHTPLGTATLTAISMTNGVDTTLGTLPWNASTNAYQKNFSGITTEPDCVTVTSNFGGSDQRIVSATGSCSPVVPSISIDDVSVDEAAGIASFTVSLSQLLVMDVIFDYATSDITAITGSDYTAQSASGHILPAGQSSVVIDVPILQDSDVEGDETFKVTLTNAVNATISDDEGIATIQDDDFAGDTVDLKFAIYTASQDKLWVKATSDHTPLGTATLTAVAMTNGVDTTLGTLPWNASKSAYQKNFGGITTEPDCVTVVSNFGGTDQQVVSATGSCSPVVPSLSIDNVSVDEAAGIANFTVSLSQLLVMDVIFDYATSDITAVAGNDYTAQSATGHILPAGQSSVAIDIPIVQDSDIEGDETFKVTLTNAANAAISDDEGIATIQDDDFAGDTVDLKFAIYTASQDKLWVKATSDHTPLGTATLTAVAMTNGVDTTLGTLPWNASKSAYQKNFGGVTTEPDCVTVTSNFGGTDQQIVSATGSCGPVVPSISIDDVNVDEAAGIASFTVSLTQTLAMDVIFDYATSDITAIAGNDYTAQSVTGHILQAGQSSVVIDVPIVQDSDIEGDETFKVTLTNIVNADLSDGEGIGTIQDDDFAGDTVNLLIALYTPSTDKLWVKATSDHTPLGTAILTAVATTNGVDT